MYYFLLIVFGFLSGVIGGMGMGGGTILIPLLTLFCSISQHSAQGYNLLAFIPMSVLSVILLNKKGFIVIKDLFYYLVTGVIFCIVGSLISRNISGNVLSKIFGIFLIILSVFQFLNALKTQEKNK